MEFVQLCRLRRCAPASSPLLRRDVYLFVTFNNVRNTNHCALGLDYSRSRLNRECLFERRTGRFSSWSPDEPLLRSGQVVGSIFCHYYLLPRSTSSYLVRQVEAHFAFGSQGDATEKPMILPLFGSG